MRMRRQAIMRNIREYDCVRVVRLKDRNRPFDGSNAVKRAPQVGDVATVCHEYSPEDPAALLAVEMVTEEGLTVWLADFDRTELELVVD